MGEIIVKGKNLIKKIDKADPNSEYNTYVPHDGELVCVTDGDNAGLVVGDGTSTVGNCKSVGAAGTRLMTASGSYIEPDYELLSESQEQVVYDPDTDTGYSLGFPTLYATCIETSSGSKTVHKTIELSVNENQSADRLTIGSHSYPLEKQTKLWMKTVDKTSEDDWTTLDVTPDFKGQLCSVYEYIPDGDTDYVFKQLWIVEIGLDEEYQQVLTWKNIIDVSA